MKQERVQDLISTLRSSGTWVPASSLARRVGVSERTVRNYVSQLTAEGRAQIESSSLGYRLVQAGGEHAGKDDEAGAVARTDTEERLNYVTTRLLAADARVSLYDLADELFVSASTISTSIVPRLRRLAKRFGLTLDTRDYALSLTGPEEDIRKLLGYLATHTKSGYFTSVGALEDMFPDYDVRGMLNKLVEICQASELFLNDYALNNLLMHLIVILVRLQSGNTLGDEEGPVAAHQLVENLRHREEIIHCVDQIIDYAEREFHVRTSLNDYRQVVALISLATEAYAGDELTRDRLVKLVGEEFFDTVIELAAELSERYGLAEFNEDFLLQLSLHMHNADQRTVYGAQCPNPIASAIKREYAPVYDMAVFFTHRFGLRYGITLSEDEIGFVAFHLGNYLEEHKGDVETVTCIVVFERYHNFVSTFMRRLEQAFHGQIDVVSVVDYQSFLDDPQEADLVITTIGLPSMPGRMVLVSPLLSERNVVKIRGALETVQRQKQALAARAYLRKFLTPDLYLRNRDVDGPEGAIRLLGRTCLEAGVIEQGFVEDVLLRERISGTAFTDVLAVPHAITENARRSFMAVLHNDQPIPWGERHVSYVIMIGLASSDTRYFQDVLDLCINMFLSPKKSVRLLQAHTYEQFIEVLTA